MKYDTVTFIKKAKEIHNNKYDYSLTTYIKSNIKIKINCPEHGIFEQTPVSHIRNNKPRGCPLCSGKNKTTKQFIIEANKVHNNKYDYSKVNYINSSTLITIICPTHGEFMQRVNTHLSGHGCPNCNKSKGELCIEYHLLKNNISYISQKTFNDCIGDNKKLKFDFYLPQYNILIEYDGKQHFTPINYFGGIKSYLMTKKYDEIKNKYAGDNNIKLIRISYESFDLIEKIILENII